MTIKSMDDIEREKNKEERDRLKKDAVEDINDIIGGVFKRPARKKKSFFGFTLFIFKFLGILALGILIINLILGNIWLLKFFMKSLFGMG